MDLVRIRNGSGKDQEANRKVSGMDLVCNHN